MTHDSHINIFRVRFDTMGYLLRQPICHDIALIVKDGYFIQNLPANVARWGRGGVSSPQPLTLYGDRTAIGNREIINIAVQSIALIGSKWLHDAEVNIRTTG